ncbi:MAG: trypsin-like peptidase domain-containing protein [Lachnospiraceae bacterium]|nr:trypsin-like peptidase domain-containing protein [Lachnospiraceae bacterium]
MKQKKKKGFGKKFVITMVCGLLCGLLTAGGLTGYSYIRYQKEKKAEEAKKQEEEKRLEGEELAVSGEQKEAGDNRVSSVYDVSVVWDNTIPSMVTIDTRRVTYYEFFGRTYEDESEGSGSGVIIAQADELFIVTNHHVIDGATAIQVTFVDGSTAPATIKGSNATEDIAVLCVQFSDLTKETLQAIKVATIGDSDLLTGGEMVIAIGNAAGGGQSLTVGYVSAVDREVEIQGVPMKLIQTDAAINPGNSGGALLDATGALIGINNAKLVATKVEGVGYAIPISNVISLIHQLVNREEIDYEDSAVIGIVGQDVTENLSEALNIPIGVYIKEFSEDSPARDAGIPLFSVITEVNGMEVKTMEQLRDVLGHIRGGSTGTVTVQERVEGEYEEKEYEITFSIRGK